MKTLLDGKQLNEAIEGIVRQIKSDIPADTDIAVIGIRSRGEILAKRLVKALSSYFTGQILNGTLDITLYRDDLNEPKEVQPTVRSTEINFDITDKLILLADDVLHTGRSVRAAMDALTDLGRPRMVRLAVLVDRGHHEYPICADYTGLKTDVQEPQVVRVHFTETDNEDRVIIE
ncbi:MAG TPA: bifunctional pyr operon transcriptional regulator/uracil phosphoribosyltransferase PyrR [Anaerohalosphaeraceae bacterium]|nr:bifunctional pyr operon transcriptional regulator/uracil phosphoribosyltransferase PyrR [Phycisphaerae bacterium]HOK95932.1 bifunctional pyr operon transcriptional regulator/uracil phosphoribosyltransferase PyrR [Anaerohalosphaeraceae bacterium]HOL30624.1 bifunctional pyr operon transcriptional regulator/uracil phosphoribosyltransferase PyrR [Anaerohalosphaeraceae bacterium]HOM75289.1 bifunctional pyr operon transcriptional regulator/uracil phosphoribosyltransferase PyrR [Anaerohalosphaeracea